MNLLVTILSLTPAVGAVFRLLEQRSKGMPPQKTAVPGKRRSRQRKPRQGNHARMVAWRRKKPRNPLRALRAA